jgi:hypothetical protein
MEPETEHQEKMDAWIAHMKDGRKERKARQEVMEASPEKTEPNPEMMQSVAEHQEVPTEHATVETGKVPKKRHRGRHLAAGHHRKPKELTRGDCGSRGKLAATCRKMTRHAGMAQHKGHGRKRQMLEKEPRKDKRNRRDVGRTRDAKMA